jgi:hypothetical protein
MSDSGSDSENTDYEETEEAEGTIGFWGNYSVENDYVMDHWDVFCDHYMDDILERNTDWRNRFNKDSQLYDYICDCIKDQKIHVSQELSHYLDNYKYVDPSEKIYDIMKYHRNFGSMSEEIRNNIPNTRTEFFREPISQTIPDDLYFPPHIKIGMIMKIVELGVPEKIYDENGDYEFPNVIFDGFSDKLKDVVIDLIEEELKKDFIPDRIKALERELELFMRFS